MKKIQVETKKNYFNKFEDIHFNQKEDEVIALSLYKMKNRQVDNQNNKMRLPFENKIELLRGLKENLEQKLQEERQNKQCINIIRKMQKQEERLEQQNSQKNSNKDQIMDLQNSNKENKKELEEIVILVKGLNLIEKDLCKFKSERNKISEQLEDAKYDLIDSKNMMNLYGNELIRQDVYMSQLKKKITIMSYKGQSTPKEYINNLNSSRLNQTRLNTTIIEDVKFKFENVKYFFKDTFNKVRSNIKGNNGDTNQPQNTNRILTGFNFQ